MMITDYHFLCVAWSMCRFSFFMSYTAYSLSVGKWKTWDIEPDTFSVDTHQAEGGSVLQLPFQHHSMSLHSLEPWTAVTCDPCPSELPLNSIASHSQHWQEDDAESCVNKHHKALSLVKHMTPDQENAEEPSYDTKRREWQG